MIYKAWKKRLALVSAAFILLAPAISQTGSSAPVGDTTGTRAIGPNNHPPPDKRRRPDAPAERKGNQSLERRDTGKRHHPREFRKLMHEELKHLPALNQPMDRFTKIQAERYELQQKRQNVAGDTTRDREATLRRFHSLLQRDLQLSDEARVIADTIVEDMPQIQKQLDHRRAQLNRESGTRQTTSTEAETLDSQTREMRRRLLYLDILEKKLGELTIHPERLDLLARVIRDLPPEDGSTHDSRDPRKWEELDKPTTQTPLMKLQGKRRELQRELRQVEKKIHDMRRRETERNGPSLP